MGRFLTKNSTRKGENGNECQTSAICWLQVFIKSIRFYYSCSGIMISIGIFGNPFASFHSNFPPARTDQSQLFANLFATIIYSINEIGFFYIFPFSFSFHLVNLKARRQQANIHDVLTWHCTFPLRWPWHEKKCLILWKWYPKQKKTSKQETMESPVCLFASQLRRKNCRQTSVHVNTHVARSRNKNETTHLPSEYPLSLHWKHEPATICRVAIDVKCFFVLIFRSFGYTRAHTKNGPLARVQSQQGNQCW